MESINFRNRENSTKERKHDAEKTEERRNLCVGKFINNWMRLWDKNNC